MSDVKKRVVEELQELSGRREKLWAFVVSTRFGEVKSDTMRHLLLAQHSVMRTYESVLEARLACWETEE
jgi:hypothetical protein